MNGIKNLLGSFRIRVLLALVLAMFLMAVASDLLVLQAAIQAQFEQMRNKLKGIASSIASIVDPDMLKAIPLNRGGIRSPEYRTVFVRLERIKQENPTIGFIYIMMRTERENVLQFVVDPDPYLTRKGSATAYPGDRYDATRFPEMVQAFNGTVAEKKIQTDQWGTMISGYAPVLDQYGKAVAVVGVDMMASDIYKMQRAVHKRVFIALLLGIGLSLLIGLWFSARLTGSVRALAEGINRVSRGELEYKITVRGHDEIAELSRSFNKMAEDLRVARQKNHDYFYGVVKSLVRIVEARDPYTCGHSERVADYATRIAARLGFPSKKIEMLRQAGVLHDIGKLGIHEDILTKPGKLTPQEWELLRNHPVIGEDILRPVFLDPEMLAIVRGHHERYDGNGYPDRLAGDDINIFVQILSVADAYDAMTSTRPYRGALDRSQAIEEIKKNRGAQFSPRIADIFIDLLNEENRPA